MKTGLEKMVEFLEFLKSRPIGRSSGKNLFSRMYLHAVDDMLDISRSLLVEEQAQKSTTCKYWDDRVDGICSRELPNSFTVTTKPTADKGLAYAVSKCPVHNKAITKHGDSPASYTCKEEMKGCVSCPITEALSRYKPTESLAELADRKNYWIQEILKTHRQKPVWIIAIQCHEVEVELCDQQDFSGKTYTEAENKARAYLESLPDKKEEGK